MNQDDVIRRLTAGEAFGSVPERIDTHISVIFLAGNDVYKLKRELITAYLDYSSLDARHRFCMAELTINRRTAPAIYLDVLPVRLNKDGALALGDGDGQPVEWLVHMSRFDQKALFDHMATEGRLSTSILVELADAIATFHGTAKPVPDPKASQRIAWVIEQNASELGKRVSVINQTMADTFDRRSRAAFEANQNRLDRRGAEGFVRHCHGDLHLRNICLYDGQPTIFDAIEFSDTISHIDVLFDLAFLLMDLEHRDLRSDANAVFNRYLYRTRDTGDLTILPLFLALRAGIRAHVAAMTADTLQDADAGLRARDDANAYLRLGLALLEGTPPILMAMGGLSGVGKSSVARHIAPLLGRSPGALILGSDLIRKRLMGVSPLTRLPPEAYGADIDKAVYDEMEAVASTALANGYAVILDGTFQDPARRHAAAALARDAGVPFDGVWLEADREKLVARVRQRTGDPSDATVPVLEEQMSRTVGEIDWHRIDAAQPIDAVSRKICNTIPTETIRTR